MTVGIGNSLLIPYVILHINPTNYQKITELVFAILESKHMKVNERSSITGDNTLCHIFRNLYYIRLSDKNINVVKNSILQIVIRLLEKGSDINMQNNKGDTVGHLYLLSLRHPFHIILPISKEKPMIFSQINVNMLNIDGLSPLDVAFQTPPVLVLGKDQIYPYVFDMILDMSSPQLTDDTGANVLHRAIRYHENVKNKLTLEEKIIKIINKGYDVNLLDNNGKTPLNLAEDISDSNPRLYARMIETVEKIKMNQLGGSVYRTNKGKYMELKKIHLLRM